MRCAETYLMHLPLAPPFSSLGDVLSLFAAVTVLIYLAMELVYGSRAAGAFVMPIVALSIVLQIVTAGREAPVVRPPPLQLVAVQAHIVANFIAYGAFFLGAALAAMLLLRRTHSASLVSVIRLRGAPDPERFTRLMHRANMIGFALLSVATMIGMLASMLAVGRYWSWEAKQVGALGVWVSYGAYLLAHYGAHWCGARMAWWSLGSFLFAIFSFLGANLLHTVIH